MIPVPRGCAIIAAVMMLFNGIIFLFGWHKGGEDLSGGGAVFTLLALASLYVLFKR